MSGRVVDPFAVRIQRAQVPYFQAQVVRTVPHDPGLFSEGLCTVPGGLLESVGRYGESAVLRYHFGDPVTVRSAPAPVEVFGESICCLGDTAYQLTYAEHRVLIWRISDLTWQGELRYDRQGWGVGATGQVVYTTDGSAELVRRQPHSFAVTGTVTVRIGTEPVTGLHDVTLAGQDLWITRTRSHWVVRVDPATGQVTGAANLRRAFHDVAGRSDWGVTAITAASEADQAFWATGKHYPYLINLRLHPPPHSPRGRGNDNGVAPLLLQ